jgi:opacity protein-like surface antigen
MRKLLLAATAFASLSVPAFAADMAVKATPPVPFTAAASGFYWGVGTYAGVAQSNVSGSNLFGGESRPMPTTRTSRAGSRCPATVPALQAAGQPRRSSMSALMS